MKPRPLTRLCLILLTACLLLAGCAETSSSSGSGTPRRTIHALFLPQQGTHEEIAFSSLSYERPDIAALDALLDDALAQVEAGAIDEALSLYDDINTDIVHYSTMATLASIYSDLDVTDEYYADETLLLQENYTRLDNRMNDLTDALLACPRAEEVRELWGEEFIERYEWYSALNDPSIEGLKAEEQALVNEYREACAENTAVERDGVQVTMDDLDFSSAADIITYYDISKVRNETLGNIYLELVRVRCEIAATLGYDNYADYAYAGLGCDYTKEDAAEFCAAVLDWFVPVDIQIDALYGDAIYEAESRVQIAPEDALPWFEQTLSENDFPVQMTSALQYMQRNGLYNFGGGENRMPTAYTTMIDDYTAPFLFINTDEYPSADTLFHEFGHYYSYYCASEPGWNDSSSLDLAEVHSQGLELLMLDAYDSLYGEDAEIMRSGALQQMVSSVLQGCMEEEFQQAVFASPEMTLEELNSLHSELSQKYLGYPMPYEWVEIPHNFEVPFYYISYATSAVSALELWTVAREDRAAALDMYNELTRHCFNAGYRDTLLTVGLSDPFTEMCIPEVALMLDEALNLGLLEESMAA